MKKILISMTAILLACGAVTGCKDKPTGPQPVKGTIEQKIEGDSIPKAVPIALDVTTKTPGDERFECILDDKDNEVSVWVLTKCSDKKTSDGYGITVVKGGVETDFNIFYGKKPKAYYNKHSRNLWIVGNVSEDSVTKTEMPYLMRFDKDKKAHIIASIDPYDMQQELCKRITYNIDGQNITLYADSKPLTTVTDKMQDMGGFDDAPIWIGEKISYLMSRNLTLCFVPGINHVVGKVLNYDDMPIIAATVDVSYDGFTVTDFRLVKSN